MPTTAPAPEQLDELLAALDVLDRRGEHPAIGPELADAIGVLLVGYRDLAAAHVERGERLRAQHAALTEQHRRWQLVRRVLGESGRYVEVVDVERALGGEQ